MHRQVIGHEALKKTVKCEKIAKKKYDNGDIRLGCLDVLNRLEGETSFTAQQTGTSTAATAAGLCVR